MRDKSTYNFAPAVAQNKLYKEINDHHRALAERYRNGRVYSQEFAYVLYKRMKDYVDEVRGSDKPITISGLILASGINKLTWYSMKNGKKDYELFSFMDCNKVSFEDAEYIDGLPYVEHCGNIVLLITFSEVIEKILLMHEDETETRLYEKGRVGDIFALRSQHHWQEEQSPQTVNQTLVIASEEQARKAIEMLK